MPKNENKLWLSNGNLNLYWTQNHVPLGQKLAVMKRIRKTMTDHWLHEIKDKNNTSESLQP